MRAALLLSAMFVIFGLSALFFDVPAVYVNGKPVFGVLGFATALLFAAVPPLVVLGWRKVKGE